MDRAKKVGDTGHCLGFHCSERECPLEDYECGGRRFGPFTDKQIELVRLSLTKR